LQPEDVSGYLILVIRRHTLVRSEGSCHPAGTTGIGFAVAELACGLGARTVIGSSNEANAGAAVERLQNTPLEKALTRLRIVRNGGYRWTAQELEEKLRALAFEQIDVYAPAPPVMFVTAQRPK
jgi:hypothetical protein